LIFEKPKPNKFIDSQNKIKLGIKGSLTFELFKKLEDIF
jgi:hypothetical protein